MTKTKPNSCHPVCVTAPGLLKISIDRQIEYIWIELIITLLRDATLGKRQKTRFYSRSGSFLLGKGIPNSSLKSMKSQGTLW